MESDRHPIYGGLKALLTSRRFIVAVISFIVGIIVIYVPELKEMQTEVMVLAATLGLSLIAGYTVVDAVTVARSSVTEIDLTNVEELVREVVESILEISAVETKTPLETVQIQIQEVPKD